MFHPESHNLCNKLQKWMNVKSLTTTHCQGTHSKCSHNHPHTNNSIIKSSPYKKTSFENLLRRYPKQEEEMKTSRLNFDPETKENPKRTFESRVIKYDNIKSKIDTNLGNIKLGKFQSIIPSVNDENRDTENINLFSKENENEKLTYQKPLIKKIKLNSQNFFKFQQKDVNNEYDSIEEMIQNHKFWPSGYTQQEPGKFLFKINVAKKINLCKKYEQQQSKNEDIQQQVSYSPIKSEKSQRNYPIQDLLSQNLKSEEKLVKEKSSSELMFMELKEKVIKEQGSQLYSENQDQNGIFTLDGQRIMDENESEQKEQQQELQEYQSIFEFTSKKPLIQIQQSENEADKVFECPQKVNEVKQALIELTERSENRQPIKTEQILNLIEIMQSRAQQSLTQKQNVDSNMFIPSEQKNLKQKLQHLSKKQSKPKKQTKILTRSKQEKLNLFNKLSMRLIRKKYGYELSHQELADKMLSEECRIELRAFIESQSLKSHKTIFNFNQLSTTQMRNTLIKYFDEEEVLNN